MQYSTISRGAGHDNGVDAAIPQYFLKVCFDKFLCPGLHNRLIADRGNVGHRIANHVTIDNAVDDKNVVRAGPGQQLLRGGQRRGAARPDFLVAVLLDKIDPKTTALAVPSRLAIHQ